MDVLVRNLLLCPLLLLVLTACGAPAEEANTVEAATPTFVPTVTSTVEPTITPTPESTATPMPEPTATVAPSPQPGPTQTPMSTGEVTTFTHPDGLWSILYPADRLQVEQRSDELVVFRGEDGSFFAVDSYLAPASEFGNTGENLRNRATETLRQLLTSEFSQLDFMGSSQMWDTGVTYTTATGMHGQAFYQQPDQPSDPFRVYGVLYGYPATADAAARSRFENMRDSFEPLELASPAPDTAATEAERIRFAPGTTSAVVEGAVVRGTTNRYVLGASANQTMTVTLMSLEQNAVFTIYGPDGGALPGAAEGQDVTNWSGTLPLDGDYIVSVASTRGNATYTLEVTILP